MLKQTHLREALTILGLASMLNLASVCFPELVKGQTSDRDEVDLPDRREAGGRRGEDRLEAGGHRGEPDACNFNPRPLTALIPESLIGTTAAASPTLFFYTPPLAEPKQVEFVLYDEKQDERTPIYETTFTITGKEGIMSVSLPTSEKTNLLKTNREYRWQLRIVCDKRYPAKDAFVEGLFWRVKLNPAFANKLKQASSLEQVQMYQEAHLWHETLSVLVELKRSQPEDPAVAKLWNQVLQSVNLNQKITQEPLLGADLSK